MKAHPVLRTLRAALLVLLAAGPALGGDAFEISKESLEEISSHVLPLVEKETGATLGEAIVFRLTPEEELRKILRAELGPQMKVQFPDEAQAKQQTEFAVALLAPSLLAKYAFGTRTVHVCPSNFDKVFRLLGEPKLRTRKGFCAVLTHECVHAADDIKYGIARTVGTLKTTSALQAYNAVLEGHAQHVARKICNAQGWKEGFDAFTRSIGRTPEDDSSDEGLRYFSRILTAAFAAAYYDGERFIDALVKKGGSRAVDRAFTNPPADVDLIFHPEWFLDPASRPKLTTDLSRALDVLGRAFDAKVWFRQKAPVAKPQLRAAFSLLPPGEVVRVLKDLKQMHSLALAPASGLRDRMIVVVLGEFHTTAGALNYLAASERLTRIKDERMKAGFVKILSAKYENLRREGIQGLYIDKAVESMGQRIPARCLVAVRGTLGLELTFSNVETDREKLVEYALRTLRAAAEPADPAPSEEGKKPGEDSGKGTEEDKKG
jgi:hypothetical protein